MNKYEAMIIFPESVKDSDLEDVIGQIKADIKKLGGETENVVRMGKRAFARVMRKQASGTYVLLVFSMEGGQIRALSARLALNEDVFRVQIVRAHPRPLAEVKAPEETVVNGDAQ